MTKLETIRLRLREMDDRDAQFMLQILNEPAFVRNIGDRGVRTVEEAKSYLTERITSRYESCAFGMWTVELKETGEAIGISGLIKRDTLQDVDLGFSFLERFWRRGLAFEAAAAVMDFGWEVVQLSRLIAIVAPHNTGSIRLLEKLGFSREGNVCLVPSEPELLLYGIARPD